MIKKLAILTAVSLAMAVPASAQGLSISFGKRSHNQALRVGVHVGNNGVLVGGRYRSGRVHRVNRRAHRRANRRANRIYRTPRVVRRHRQVCQPRFRIVRERYWVPGCRTKVFVPARYAWRIDRCGRRVRYCVQEAHYRWERTPGHWEYRNRRVYY